MNVGARLREISAAHPPGRRTVPATRYGIAGTGVGKTVRDKRAYARQRYRDSKEAMSAAKRETRIRGRAQAARVSKKAGAR